MIAAGEIYVADLSEAGSHPVIVVSREALNRGRYALVVAYASAPIRRAQRAAQLCAIPSRPIRLQGRLRRSVREPVVDRQEPTRSGSGPPWYPRRQGATEYHQGDRLRHRIGLRTRLIVVDVATGFGIIRAVGCILRPPWSDAPLNIALSAVLFAFAGIAAVSTCSVSRPKARP